MSIRQVFRVAVAGLDERDVRLIEIVFKHSQYNRFDFQLLPQPDPLQTDILIANPANASGLDALSALRALSRDVPAVSALPRGTQAAARHAITIDRLTLQLLPTLNRVVEIEGLEGRQEASGDPGTAGAGDKARGTAETSAEIAALTERLVQPIPASVRVDPAASDRTEPAARPAPAAHPAPAGAGLRAGGRSDARTGASDPERPTSHALRRRRSDARLTTRLDAGSVALPSATGAFSSPTPGSPLSVGSPAVARQPRTTKPQGPSQAGPSSPVSSPSALRSRRAGGVRVASRNDATRAPRTGAAALVDAGLPGIPTVATRIAIPGDFAAASGTESEVDVFATLDLDALFAAATLPGPSVREASAVGDAATSQDARGNGVIAVNIDAGASSSGEPAQVATTRRPDVVARRDEAAPAEPLASTAGGSTAIGRVAWRAGRRLLEELAVPEIDPLPARAAVPLSTPLSRPWTQAEDAPRRGTHAYLLQILVADPSLAAQQQLVRALQTDGVGLQCVSGASAALQLAAERQFDLVITEYNLADVSGFHLIKALRQRAGYRSTPILLLRSRSGLLDAARARLHGDVLLLNKPLTKAELQVVVADALRRSLVLDDLETLYSDGDLQR